MANPKESATYARHPRLVPHLNPEFRAPPARSAPPFEDIDRILRPHGMVGIISQRRRDGVLTFAIVREWETTDSVTHEVKMTRGSFCPSNLMAEYVDMVKMISERIAELEANPHLLPFALPASRA